MNAVKRYRMAGYTLDCKDEDIVLTDPREQSTQSLSSQQLLASIPIDFPVPAFEVMLPLVILCVLSVVQLCRKMNSVLSIQRHCL
jgi:hypothetical protein